MTARPGAQWSEGAAGPVLAAVPEPVWQDSALCAQVDPDLFFPPNGALAGTAREICRRCPVRARCLGYALDLEHAPGQQGVQGIFGGLGEAERTALRRALGFPEPRPQPDTVIPPVKRCNGPCARNLALSEFHRNASARDGRDSRCRECVSAARAAA